MPIYPTWRFLIAAMMLLCQSFVGHAQVDERQAGAWYMIFFQSTFHEGPWGIQGDVQYRNWNLLGDLEQLLLRGGLTYQPTGTPVKFTLGYGHVTTGAFGDDDASYRESRIYQESLYPARIGNRFYLQHRFRFEQRFVEDQDVRTRYRYNLFLNIPLNRTVFEAGTLYLALYNEIFINGQRSIGQGKTVELFDRNRLYAGLGIVISHGTNVQAGIMQQATDNWRKNQLQLSLHQHLVIP